MGGRTVAHVLDVAPVDLTAAERLILVVVAELTDDATGVLYRPRSEPLQDVLVRRTGLRPSALRSALQRLNGRGLEVRVPVGLSRAGRPIFAYSGRSTDYRLPDRIRPGNGDGPPSPNGDGRSSAKGDDENPERRRPEPEKVTTEGPKGDDRSSPHPPLHEHQPPLHEHQPPPDPAAALAVVVVASLPERIQAGTDQRRIIEACRPLLDRGWTPEQLHVAAESHGWESAHSAGAVVSWLQGLTYPLRTRPTRPPRPPWCGDVDCDEGTRLVTVRAADGRDVAAACPRCHPTKAGAA